MLAASSVVVVLASSGGPADGGDAPRDMPTVYGDVLLLGSGFILAIKILYTKYAVTRVPPGTLILWHDIVGVVMFFAASAMFESFETSRWSAPAIWGLFYQGVMVAGLCFAIQARLLRRHSASAISVFSFATPLFGIVAAWLFRNDYLSAWLLLSAVLVAVGIVLVNRKTEPQEAPDAQLEPDASAGAGSSSAPCSPVDESDSV